MAMRTALFASFSALVLTSACSGFSTFSPKLEDARYWQRKSVSSALYMQGPKAQQMLHVDIASCSNEIKELQNLGAIREVIPTNYNHGNTMEPRTAAKAELDEWDTPERDGYLYAEHLNYHDFESCMHAKGWERAQYLSYSDVDKAREEYLVNTGRKRTRSLANRENVTSLDPNYPPPASYNNLNQ